MKKNKCHPHVPWKAEWLVKGPHVQRIQEPKFTNLTLYMYYIIIGDWPINLINDYTTRTTLFLIHTF
jgi:hypothetical protein